MGVNLWMMVKVDSWDVSMSAISFMVETLMAGLEERENSVRVEGDWISAVMGVSMEMRWEGTQSQSTLQGSPSKYKREHIFENRVVGLASMS